MKRFIAVAAMLFAAWSQAGTAQPPRTILYVLRHAEVSLSTHVGGGVQWRLSPIPGAAGTFQEVCPVPVGQRRCCIMPLNALGVVRAQALATWFAENNLARTITHVIATNKPRTVQTLSAIASEAGVPVVQAPPGVGECDPGFELTQDSMPYVLDAIHLLPLGSRAVVANHGETIYPIMAAIGVDVSDPVLFPKDPGNPSRPDGFNNLWVVELNASGEARLLRHLRFDLALDPGGADGFGRARGAGDWRE